MYIPYISQFVDDQRIRGFHRSYRETHPFERSRMEFIPTRRKYYELELTLRTLRFNDSIRRKKYKIRRKFWHCSHKNDRLITTVRTVNILNTKYPTRFEIFADLKNINFFQRS